MGPDELLRQLEEISRQRPDRLLRLSGTVVNGSVASGTGSSQLEPCELLIFRGFSSSTTHPTSFDPDQLVIGSTIAFSRAELLAAPLIPGRETVLVASDAADQFLDPSNWA